MWGGVCSSYHNISDWWQDSCIEFVVTKVIMEYFTILDHFIDALFSFITAKGVWQAWQTSTFIIMSVLRCFIWFHLSPISWFDIKQVIGRQLYVTVVQCPSQSVPVFKILYCAVTYWSLRFLCGWRCQLWFSGLCCHVIL